MNKTHSPIFAKRAVLRLSLIEFWERYSFFTMFALLALFVAAPVADGGLGWDNGTSLRFFGVYLLAVQTAPIVGGYAADNWIGKRTSLVIGAISLLLGHSLLATAATLPWLGFGPDGQTLAGALGGRGSSLGGWSTAALPEWADTPYRLVTACFFGAVALVALGNGLFKPILTVIVGRLPHADEAARTAAFTTFFLYINVGGLLSILAGGYLAQSFGWGWAFAASASGMIVAMITMALLQRKYIFPFVGPADATDENGGSGAGISWIKGIVALLLLLVVCSSFSFQSYGFVSLFTAQLVERDVAGFMIPPSWFTALNPITIMIVTPILLAVWRRGRAGGDFTTVQQFAVSLAFMAIGFAPLVAATVQVVGDDLASPLWVMAAIALIAVSEIYYAPAAMAASTRIAPPNQQALAIGLQGGAIGVGAWLSGQLGALAFESNKVAVMSAIAVTAFIASAVLIALRSRFAQYGL